MHKHAMACALVLAAAAFLPGCPALDPPFDTTGDYSGTFAIGTEDIGIVDGCTLAISLEQDVDTKIFDEWRVSGTVELNFSCILGQELSGLLGLLADEAFSVDPIEVEGLLLPDGTLELNTPDLFDACPETGCAKLAMLGEGVDDNRDGAMDSYSGAFGGVLQLGTTQVPVIGEFEVTVDEE